MLAEATISTQNLPEEIFDLLRKEVDLSREMLTLLDEEKTALVAMDMSTMIELGGRKLKLLSRIRALDEALQAIGRQLSESTAPAIKLSTLVELANGEERQQLESLRQHLLTLREQILSKNIVNKYFAADTGRYLRDAISLITTAAAEQNPAYGKAKQGGKAYNNQPTLISREV